MKKAVLISLAVLCIAAVGLELSKTSAKQGVVVVPLSSDPFYSAGIGQRVNCMRLIAPLIIDGDPNDWPFGDTIELDRGTAYSFSGSIDSPSDLSAAIRSGWDDEWLYLLVQVTDDKVMADSKDVWRDDGVEIGLDGLHDEYPWGSDDHQYTIVVDGRTTDRAAPTTQIATAILEYEGGYNIELAIPVVQLIPGTPVSGTLVGFTVGLHDDDDGGNWDAYLIWQGTNTSSSPEQFGGLAFMERAEDRLAALEARIVKLEDRIRELLAVLGEFGEVTLPTLTAPGTTPAPTATPTAPTSGETATPGPSGPTPTATATTRTHTPTATATTKTRTPTATPTAVVIMTPTPTVAVTTVVLQQGVDGYVGCEDTYFDRNSPTANYCAQEQLRVGVNQWYAGLLRFDVSAIPTNAVVTRATLQLYATGWGGVNMTLGMSVILRTMTACEANWNQAQNGNPWGQPGCNSTATDRRSTVESVVRTDGPKEWSTFNLTSAVQSWVNGSLSNNGVLLHATVPDLNEFMFASAEVSDVSLRPKLVITYYIPAGAATTLFPVIAHVTDGFRAYPRPQSDCQPWCVSPSRRFAS